MIPVPNKYWRDVVGFAVDFGDWLVDLFNDAEAAELLLADLGLANGSLPPLSLPQTAELELRPYSDGRLDLTVEATMAPLVELVDGVQAIVRTLDPSLQTDDETWPLIHQLLGVYGSARFRQRYPVAYAIGKAAGVFVEKFGTVDGFDIVALLTLFAKPPAGADDPDFTFDERLVTILTDVIVFVVQQILLSAVAEKMHDPDDWFDSYYGWDTPPEQETRADVKVLERMYTLVFREALDTADDGLIGGSLLVTLALVPSEHGGPGLFVSLGGAEVELVKPVGNRVLTLSIVAPSPGGFYIDYNHWDNDDAEFGFSGVSVSLRLDPSPELAGSVQPWFDYSDGAVFLRLDQGNVRLTIAGAEKFGIDVGAVAHLGIRKTASPLLDKLFDRDIEVDFNIDVGWHRRNGLAVKDGSGAQGKAPATNKGSRFVRLHDVSFGLQPTGLELNGLEAFFVTSVTLDLGPFKAVIEQFGAHQQATLAQDGAGFDTGFSIPRGVALSLEAGGLKGAGYLFIDPDRNEYAGVLELSYQQFSFKAVGILTTEVPNRPDSWAFVALITFEFPPWGPISGVGGIVGYHHGLSIPALQEGLRTGVLDSILFPEDPIANPAHVINHIRTVFPITPGAVTVGIMLQLSAFAGRLQVMLGLLLQWDNATWGEEGDASLNRLSVIGRLQVKIPADADEPRIQFILDVAGSYDFGAGLLAIDGVLRDSRIGKLTFTGSGSVRRQARRRYDPETGVPAALPSQIITVGGWHPRFTDVPAGIPKQYRVGFSIKSKPGAGTKYEVSCMAYYASTPNTSQIGLEAKAKAKKWGFTLSGRFSFDGIWYENPDYFELDIEFEASLKRGDKTWAKIDLDIYLRGSGYWIVTGVATIKVLLISKKLNIHEEWGSELPPVFEEFMVEDALAEAIQDLRNWVPELPAATEMLVSLRNPGAAGEILAHPFGDLSFTQNVVPLGITIERFGQYVPGGADRFDIERVVLVDGDGEDEATTPLTEYFSPGEFLHLTPEQKLTTPSFERFEAGVRVDVAEHAIPNTWVSATPDYELKYRGQDLPDADVTATFEATAAHALVGAAARSTVGLNPFAGSAPRAPVGVASPRVVVVADGSLDQLPDSESATYTEARQAVTGPAQLVVEAHELEVAQ